MTKINIRQSAFYPILLGTVMTTSLSGCGVFSDKTDSHLEAKELPPMVIPQDMDNAALGQLYPVPNTGPVEVLEDYTVPRPLPVSANVFEETVKIQSFDDSTWILINKPPEEIWPRVRNILNRSGIPTQNIDASRGTLETIWIKFKNDDTTSHRFKLAIEPAIQINSTEVKILQMQTPVGTEEQALNWPDVSNNSSREREMLDIVSNALASDLSGPSVSLLAQSIGGEEKVELVIPKVADSYLELKLSYERAWASVEYSLNRGGFTILDKNQLVGTFDVSYIPESLSLDDEPGFFGRLFSFAGNGDDKVEGVKYLVIVKDANGTVQVRIVGPQEQGLDKGEANRLLEQIRSNLS